MKCSNLNDAVHRRCNFPQVVGLINNNNDNNLGQARDEATEGMSQVSQTCSLMWKRPRKWCWITEKNQHVLLYINGTAMERGSSVKFLWINSTENLTSTINTPAVPRRLSSISTHSAGWGEWASPHLISLQGHDRKRGVQGCNAQERKQLNRMVRTACEIIILSL